MKPFGGSRISGGDPGAEDNRARRPRRRDLDNPEAFAWGDIRVKSPAKRHVELLGSIDVGNREDDDLQLEVGCLATSGGGVATGAVLNAAHEDVSLSLAGCGRVSVT